MIFLYFYTKNHTKKMKEIWFKYFNFKNQLKNNKIYSFVKILFCIVFSFFIMMDSTLVFGGDIVGKLLDNYFTSITYHNIGIFIITFLISYLVITLIEVIVDKLKDKVYSKKIIEHKSKKIFIIAFAIILVLWLPYILSFFPGGIFADTIVSINEALGNTKLYNHNPVLYTLILRLFFNIGMAFSDSNGISLGLMLFTTAQVIAMDGVISYFIYWTYKRGISLKYVILEILFFGLFKLIPLYAISLWKDTIFCLALFLYIIFLADIVYEKGKNLTKVTGIIHYLILMTLVIFLRNNGIYIILFTTIILFFIFRKKLLKQLRRFSIATIIMILICYTIQGPIFKMLNMNTEFVENLGMFLQQICYVVSKDGNMTEEQKEFINNIMPIESIKSAYSPCLIDSIKWSTEFNSKYIEDNKGKFFKVWFQMFLQNPVAYVKAYLLNSIGFWDVNEATFNAYTNHTMWPTLQEAPEYKQNDYIEKLTNHSIRNLLEPQTPISSAVFLFITLIGFIITVYRKKYVNLLIYCPIIATWLTIMVAVPVAFALRYVYILVLALPMSIIIPFLDVKETEETKLLRESNKRKDIKNETI